MPFAQISTNDKVYFNGKILKPEKHVYFILNKPKDYLTTCRDERGRKTVMELIQGATNVRIYPVGRLDRMSTGLLLFTNDGMLAQKLAHPSGNVEKVYRVLLNENLKKIDHKKLIKGFELEDGFIKADKCFYNNPKDKRDIVVHIHRGRNRIIRRMFQYLFYKVEKLDRVGFAGITKSDLPKGKWRFLTDDEVEGLRK